MFVWLCASDAIDAPWRESVLRVSVRLRQSWCFSRASIGAAPQERLLKYYSQILIPVRKSNLAPPGEAAEEGCHRVLCEGKGESHCYAAGGDRANLVRQPAQCGVIANRLHIGTRFW